MVALEDDVPSIIEGEDLGGKFISPGTGDKDS